MDVVDVLSGAVRTGGQSIVVCCGESSSFFMSSNLISLVGGVVRGRRSLERDRSLHRSWRISGGVSVGGGMAVVCCKAAAER